MHGSPKAAQNQPIKLIITNKLMFQYDQIPYVLFFFNYLIHKQTVCVMKERERRQYIKMSQRRQSKNRKEIPEYKHPTLPSQWLQFSYLGPNQSHYNSVQLTSHVQFKIASLKSLCVIQYVTQLLYHIQVILCPKQFQDLQIATSEVVIRVNSPIMIQIQKRLHEYDIFIFTLKS